MADASIRSWLIAGCLIAALPAGANDGGMDAKVPPAGAPADPVYARAMVEVKAGRYATAIPLLADVIKHDPRNADAFNNLGYSQRKLGQRDQAMASYAEALRLKPGHLGALEYQGELFLELGDLSKAETNLNRLGTLCGRCESYEDLAQTITAYKAKPKS